MISNIWNWIKNLFTPTRVVEEFGDTLVLKQCPDHPTKFKHRCPKCQELVA